MGRLFTFWNYIRRHKYLVAILIFLLIVGVVDENSLWVRYDRQVEIGNLRREIDKFQALYDAETAQLEAGDDLIKGAIAAAGDDEICIAGLSAGKIHGIAALFRHVNGTEITGPVKHGDHVRKETPALPGAGVGIDDQVELFHRVPPKGIAMAAAAEEISPLRLRLRSK